MSLLFFQCSQTCGGGTKRRVVVCQTTAEEESGEAGSSEADSGEDGSERCDRAKKPPEVFHCNTEPCPRWNFGAWGEVRPYFLRKIPYLQFTRPYLCYEKIPYLL